MLDQYMRMNSPNEQQRRYYSSRNGREPVTPQEAQWRLHNLFLLFDEKAFFKEKVGQWSHDKGSTMAREAIMRLGFAAFPMSGWSTSDMTFDRVFDVVEFLFDKVSKPGELVDMRSDSGFDYQDYESYDEEAGRREYRSAANLILADIGEGYELGGDGEIRANGSGGLEHILRAEILPFDEINVDRKVINAIEKWRKRHSTVDDRREAVRLLADVFEWLKKAQQLESAIVRKDEADLFHIANEFAIRHHSPSQKNNYDHSIWYNWMFHFYLATYHAAIRILLKSRKAVEGSAR